MKSGWLLSTMVNKLLIVCMCPDIEAKDDELCTNKSAEVLHRKEVKDRMNETTNKNYCPLCV